MSYFQEGCEYNADKGHPRRYYIDLFTQILSQVSYA